MSRNYTTIEKEIAENGFFSEYLPSCFNLNRKVFNKSPATPCDLVAPYTFTMSRYNGNDARRTLFIPEIGSYIVARNYIRQEKIIKEIIEYTEHNTCSFSPILGSDSTVMRHEQSYTGGLQEGEELTSNYTDNIARKIIMASGAKYVLKLDISNCFASFYMHMMPAILLGVDGAASEFGKYQTNSDDPQISPIYKKYRGLDAVIRQQNLNRTNGLLQGILTSKVIAEGILSRIDSDLQNEGMKFARYVDDYEVYLYDEDEKSVISIFTRVLKKYGFSLNYEKTEKVAFPYYVVSNLEKIYKSRVSEPLDNTELMELFNTFFSLEKEGTKGAIRFMLKSIEKIPIAPENPALYKAYLLTIIGNNGRALTKACSLLIEHKANLVLEPQDVSVILEILNKHIANEHDLETLWLLYLLIQTENIADNFQLITKIANSTNELAQILLLKTGLLSAELIDKIILSATSWILLYELYAENRINEDDFISRLSLNKNIEMYQYLKQNNVHFCNM